MYVFQILLQNVREMFRHGRPDRRAYAVKSADAVAAVAASGLSLACQTAPLWPRKVPILRCAG